MTSSDLKSTAVSALRDMSVRALRATEATWKEKGDDIRIDGRPAIFWVVEQAISARKQDDRLRTKALGVLTWLLRSGLSPEALHKGNTALMEAAGEGDVACARRLLSAGANISAKSTMWNTPLHWAAIGGRPAMCKFLIAQGADLSKTNQDRQTPLHCAADRLRMNTITVLHEAGAKWDLLDTHDRTPLDIITHRDPSFGYQWKNRPERERLARETACMSDPESKSRRSRRL